MTSDSSIPIENIDAETLKPPVSALKNPQAVRDAHNEMSRRDANRAWLRSRHQALYDGAPPFDHATLVANGQGGRTNVDWGDAKAAMGSVMTGQIDMIMSPENLVRVPHKRYAIPDDEVRNNFDNILSREVSRAIRNWENFPQRMLSLGQYTFGHGVGIAYFEDANTWQPEVAYLGDFLIPDGTKASEGDIPIATCRRDIELHKLYGFIRDEKAAEQMCWNVKAVKLAMLSAQPDSSYGDGSTSHRWMKLEEDLRANAVGTSYGGKTSKVTLIHCWVQEFDGTVTKYITTRDKAKSAKDAGEQDEFLFKRVKFFNEMQQGFVVFTNGVGDHGTYHSISGLLRSIYPQCQALNRAQCTMLDAAVMSCGIPIQPKTDASITRMKIGSLGGLMPVMPSEEHGTILQRVVPNVSQNVMPLVSDFRNTINNRAGSFQGTSPFQGAVERTRTEVLATMESLSKVSTTQTNLWYPPFTRLLREMVRRLCRPTYSVSLPGGKEAAKFRRRLQEAGYPLELLEQIAFLMLKVTGYVMMLAPLAVFGAIASTVSATSTNSLTVSGDTLSTIVVTSPIGKRMAPAISKRMPPKRAGGMPSFFMAAVRAVRAALPVMLAGLVLLLGAALVLLVAMIGAILLTLRHRKDVKRQNVLAQMWRDPAKAMELKDVKPGQGL